MGSSTTVKISGSVGAAMPSFISQTPVSNPMATEGNAINSSRLSDFGGFQQYMGYGIGETGTENRSPFFNGGGTNATTPGANIQNVALNMSTRPNIPTAIPLFQTVQSQKGTQQNVVPSSNVHYENWAESNMADSSSRTDTSTEMDAEDKRQRIEMGGQGTGAGGHDSTDKSKNMDQKALRRLAQNREAARKSRLRKKAYVQQLENSRLKLTQMEQELQRSRQKGVYISNMGGDPSQTASGNGAMTFDVEYSRWLEDFGRQMTELRTAVNAHATDTELRMVVDNASNHYNEIFRLKSLASKADAFHILSGMWKTPAERCFMWIGGFRPSELLKLIATHLEPLTEQQSASIYNLQQSSHQAEDALSQGMEALQQSLAETLANGSEGSSGNVANYMGQMAMAMGKLGTLEGFLRQADNLRQQTLQQMHRILTTRQSARALLTIYDYFSRLRALSSLWLARPQE